MAYPHTKEYRIITKNGVEKWILDKCIPVCWTDGKIHGFLGSVTDITDRKLAERKLMEHNEELIELNKQIANYKLMALRAAMNPHFIFNCLNSIQYFIINNNRKSAVTYLSLFSKLVRNVLDNSVNQFSNLASEIETLIYYIQLENVRFEEKFSVSINVAKNIDINAINIPSLIIQPYVENAIVHGLSNKKEKGGLKIDFFRKKDKLLCIVEDNGVGRKASEKFKSEKGMNYKSIGSTVTEERLNAINKTSNVSVKIIDLVDDGAPCGTRVELLISIETTIKELSQIMMRM